MQDKSAFRAARRPTPSGTGADVRVTLGFAGLDTLCGHKVQLFAHGTVTGNPELLGTAELDCEGHGALYALMHTCTSTCMNDNAATCCFVPKAVAWMFPCCRAQHCCPDQLGYKATKHPTFAPTAPTTAPTPVCATSIGCMNCMKYNSKAQCSGYGLDCACKTTACKGAPSAACSKCMGAGNSRTLCHSFGLGCGCGKAVPSSSRRALGTTKLNAHGGPRSAPAVAVSVSIEETSSAKSRFDDVMRCLKSAGKSAAKISRCHGQTNPAAGLRR